MLQNPCKTFGFKKNMVFKIPPGAGGGKPYPGSGLYAQILSCLGPDPPFILQGIFFEMFNFVGHI